MRSGLLLALLMGAVPLAAQRGTIDTLDVAIRSIDTGKSLSLTVRGTNPCGAVEINPGDGNIVTHPITELPATVSHTYRKPGRYEIRARGMGNCNGQASAEVTVTGQELPEPTTGTAPAAERRPEPRRRSEEPLSRRGSTAIVSAAEPWSDTGVRVREGDIVRLVASGRVVVVPGQPGVGPEGTTRSGVGNPRIPRRPGGALLGKIGDDGPPLFIGARDHTFRANRSGVLWLGVNDDYFDDNTGEFRVRISAGDEQEVGTSGTVPRDIGRETGADVVIDRDVTVRAADEWTETGVVLRAGDMLRLEATGTVRLSDNPGDVVNPTGSRTRTAADAAFPQRPAGALIARIGDGEPIFVGARQQNIRVMQDGRLWLGVNDDFFEDNGGEFLVRISVRSGR